MRTEQVDVAVVGGGPAGLAAALSAKESGAQHVLLIERGDTLGGILNQCIHDGFGTKLMGEALTGPEYARIFIDRLTDIGVSIKLDTMVLDISPERELVICSHDGLIRVKAGAIVLCTGCRERTRGAIRIPGTRPAGVFTAGVVQEYMNIRNLSVARKAVILGSGDIGLIMARRLTLEGVKVECVAEILPYPSGLARNIVQCLEDFGIPLHLSTTVVDIHGNDRVEGVTLAQIGPRGGVVRGTKSYVDCDTLLLSVGLIPENELAKKAGIELSPVTAGPIVDDQFQTSIPGIFCGGNALQVHDLVDYASMESEKAGRSASTFADDGRLPSPIIKVLPGQGIRYVVPQEVSGNESVDFSMRVKSPETDRYIVFKRGEQVIRRMRQIELAPAAMIRMRVRSDRFQGSSDPLTVEVAD